jgi:hypothetical protein
VPKIFFTNSSTEYWRGDASLIHTDAEGTRDVSLAASSRLYHFAGTQHSAGTLPLTDTNPVDGARGQQALNSVDYNPLLRAALVRMDRWVTGEEDPPPSRYPRFADDTAVAPKQLRGAFAAIPGVGFPTHPPRVIRLDFGPDAASGVATTLPPVEGKPYPHFVPAVDRDGNEVSGIRLPDLTVPLATYAGWNLRHLQMGAPDKLMSLMGATIPFPATREEREAKGDPRRSIEEHYPSRARYLEQVREEAQRLVDEGYFLRRTWNWWSARHSGVTNCSGPCARQSPPANRRHVPLAPTPLLPVSGGREKTDVVVAEPGAATSPKRRKKQDAIGTEAHRDIRGPSTNPRGFAPASGHRYRREAAPVTLAARRGAFRSTRASRPVGSLVRHAIPLSSG